MTDGTEKEFSIAGEFTDLVKQTAEAANDLSAQGHPELAQLEILRTIGTGIAALVMLAEGQLKATAYMIESLRE